jgi:hypothetical protein
VQEYQRKTPCPLLGRGAPAWDHVRVPPSVLYECTVINAVATRSHARPGFLTRLLWLTASDVGGYLAGAGRDLRALRADTVTRTLAVAMVLSQLLDVMTTLMDLTNNLAESNPVSAAVIANWGIPGLLMEKFAVCAVVGVNMARLGGRSARCLGGAATVVGLAAAAWNLHLAW